MMRRTRTKKTLLLLPMLLIINNQEETLGRVKKLWIPNKCSKSTKTIGDVKQTSTRMFWATEGMF